MSVKIYHNPRCSKSRQTLELIQQQGIEPEIITYIDTPLKPQEIEALLEKLGVEPRAAMRTKEDTYKEHNLGAEGVSRKQLIAAMSKYPKLIERPIVVTKKGVRICRPPELVKEIL